MQTPNQKVTVKKENTPNRQIMTSENESVIRVGPSKKKKKKKQTTTN